MNNPNSTHNGNPQNQANPIVPLNRSHFPLMPDLATTQRFGEISPHFLSWNIPSDGLKFLNRHHLRTYSLSAPLMQDLTLHKNYFKIPYQSILPFNFDKFFNNPTIGDDVPDDVFTSVKNFRAVICDWCSDNILPYLNLSTIDNVSSFGKLFNALILLECIFSRGSLLNTLGYNMHPLLYGSTNDYGIDDFIDDFCSALSESLASHNFGLSFLDKDNNLLFACSLNPSSDFSSNNVPVYTLRGSLEQIRDGSPVYKVKFSGWSEDDYDDDDDVVASVFSNDIEPALTDIILSITQRPEHDCDLAPLFAYQLVCAHFFTNDHVDYVYSAELYRQLIRHHLYDLLSSGVDDNFSYNGLRLPYDWLSSHYFLAVLTRNFDNIYSYMPYFTSIFSFRHSLRFMDYFVGSKTQPLAVGDVNAPVVSGEVSIIDVTQKIQVQRFLNAVNRTGRKLSNYIKGLFGADVKPDMHDPLWLGSDVSPVISNNVQNTADSQVTEPNSITSSLSSNGGDYAFEIDGEDRPSLILGVTWYDIKRFYTRSTYRNYYHRSRFDMFNPFLQFIGDQTVDGKELNPRSSNIFGYQSRYMEYKQSHSRAVGGFVKSLNGFLFLDSNNAQRNDDVVLGPSFIRSSNNEFDNFYVSLTGFSLGTYFHFINLYSNDCEYDRDMSANAQIL